MSSTDSHRAELVGRVFEEHLAPAAERLRARGVELFPLGPDRHDGDGAPRSYYRTRGDAAEATYLFELDPAADPAAELRRRWRDDPELLALVEPLAALAAALRQPDEAAGDVSPLIYAMF